MSPEEKIYQVEMELDFSHIKLNLTAAFKKVPTFPTYGGHGGKIKEAYTRKIENV